MPVRPRPVSILKLSSGNKPSQRKAALLHAIQLRKRNVDQNITSIFAMIEPHLLSARNVSPGETSWPIMPGE